MRPNRKSLYVITALITVLLAGVYSCNKESPRDVPKAEASGTPTNGALEELLAELNIYHFKDAVKAGEFELTSVTGKTVGLNQHRGKVVLLSFWATW